MSIEAFNNLLKSFLEELSKVFPSDPKLKVYSNLFDTIVVASPKLPIDMFMKAFGSEGELINKKDPAIFDKIPVLFGEIQLKQMWDSDISEANRSAIFSYLQTLYMLGTTIKSLPEHARRHRADGRETQQRNRDSRTILFDFCGSCRKQSAATGDARSRSAPFIRHIHARIWGDAGYSGGTHERTTVKNKI